jgi:hypothetical protein
MRSNLTADFRDCYRKLPEDARRDARASYLAFQQDPFTRSLHFKEVYRDRRKSIWSARTSLGWRTLGLRVAEDRIIWFWIGSHAEYDRWFRRFKRMSVPE